MSARLLIGLFAALAVWPASLIGAEKMPPPEIAAEWPGVRFSVFRVERIPGDRLLVAVRIIASAGAPRQGTLLGTMPDVPAGVSADDLSSGRYDPKPYSLAASVMTDDATGRKYPALPPDPAGKSYIPGEVLATLMPGNAEVLTVQFAAPPPPLDENGVPLKTKQTISIQFPNAKGPVTKIIIPPPLASYSGFIKVIAAKEHKEHKEVSGFARENRSLLEIFVFLCGYSVS